MQVNNFEKCALEWVSKNDIGQAYQIDLKPSYNLDFYHAKEFYKKYRLFSFMIYGECDHC